MKTVEMRFVTPRGTFKIHTVFESEEEARAMGWGLWFEHGQFLILGQDNRVGAVVELGK